MANFTSVLLPMCPCGCLTVDQKSHDHDCTVPDLPLSLGLSVTLYCQRQGICFLHFTCGRSVCITHTTVLTAGYWHIEHRNTEKHSHALRDYVHLSAVCVSVCDHVDCFDDTARLSLGLFTVICPWVPVLMFWCYRLSISGGPLSSKMLSLLITPVCVKRWNQQSHVYWALCLSFVFVFLQVLLDFQQMERTHPVKALLFV